MLNNARLDGLGCCMCKGCSGDKIKGDVLTPTSVSSALVGFSLFNMMCTLGRQEPDDEFSLHLHFLGASSPGNRKKEKETLLLREFGSSTSTIMSHCSPKAITTVTAPVREDNIRQGQGSRLHPK